MTAARNSLFFLALAGAGLLALGACKTKHEPLPLVEDLMEDRVTRDGILLKCNDPATSASMGSQCEIARIAVERLAKQQEAADAAKREQDFERNREQLRSAEAQRAELQAQQKKVDPYTMPVVPVTPAASAAPP